MQRALTSLLVGAIGLASAGCTYRAWYEGFQEGQRQQCYDLRNQGDIQKCLDQVNATTYEEYKKSREKPTSPPQ